MLQGQGSDATVLFLGLKINSPTKKGVRDLEEDLISNVLSASEGLTVME